MGNKFSNISSGSYLNLQGIKKNSIETKSVEPKQNFLNTLFKSKNLNNELDVGKGEKASNVLHNIEEDKNAQYLYNLNSQISRVDDVELALTDDNKNNNVTMQKHQDNMLKAFDSNTTLSGNAKITLNNLTDDNGAHNHSTLNWLDKINSYLKEKRSLNFFKNKGAKVSIIVTLLAVVLLMFLNASSIGGTTKSTSSTVTNFNNINYVSSAQYISQLETRLTKTLSAIKNAGHVSVMITLENGPELKIATSLDERTNTSTNSTNTTTSVTVIENPIIITQNGVSSPLILMEILPKIKGVVVVAEGAGNTKTKLELLEAVQAVLEVPMQNIQIFAGI